MCVIADARRRFGTPRRRPKRPTRRPTTWLGEAKSDEYESYYTTTNTTIPGRGENTRTPGRGLFGRLSFLATFHDDDDDDDSRRRRRRLFTTTGVRDARSFVDIGDDIHGDALVWKGAHGDARRATATATRLLRGISCTLCGDVTETFESDERIELVTTVVGVFPAWDRRRRDGFGGTRAWRCGSVDRPGIDPRSRDSERRLVVPPKRLASGRSSRPRGSFRNASWVERFRCENARLTMW